MRNIDIIFFIEDTHENCKDGLLKEMDMAQSKSKYSDFLRKTIH